MRDPSPIRHIVVLMLENRAFDHMVGFRPGVNGLKGTESNLANPADPQSTAYTVGTNAPYAISHGQGPTHSINATNKQLSGTKAGPSSNQPATNDGFVLAYIDALRSDHVADPGDDIVGVVMQSFAPGSFPSIEALADNFVLCDQWYADVPGPTQPNRLYVHAGTSAGYAHNVWSHVFNNRTIYNSIEDAGLTWAAYFSDDNDVAKFSQLAPKTYSSADEESQWESDKAAGAKGAFFTYEEFFVNHATQGKLPHYTFIEPNFGDGGSHSPLGVTSMHAPHDVRGGDRLVKQVYDALRANEEAWKSTLLIVTFDEHGGFYDHVVPPAAVNPDGLTSPQPDDPSYAPDFGFDRLGLRVPTILVSPLVAKGTVLSDPLQHTSILSTTKKLFGLSDFLTARDAAAPTFDHILLDPANVRTDTPASLPTFADGAIPTVDFASSAHLSNKKPDDLLASKTDGWHAITRFLPDGKPSSESKPTTHAESHFFMRDQVKRYTNFRHAMVKAGASPTSLTPTAFVSAPPVVPAPAAGPGRTSKTAAPQLDPAVVPPLWALFRQIGIHWGNMADSSPLYSQWLTFLQNRIITDPGYAAVYNQAAQYLTELVGEQGDGAYTTIFAPPAPTDDPRLVALRTKVSNEFIVFQLATGGFKAFGAKNYLGYFGGPNVAGQAPYRTPED